MHGNQADRMNPSNYNNNIVSPPATKSAQQQAIELYHEYMKGDLTQQEISDGHDMTVAYVNRCIKWACKHLNKGLSQEVYKEKMLHNLRERRREIQALMAGKGDLKAPLRDKNGTPIKDASGHKVVETVSPKDVSDVAILLREMRLTERLVAQLEGLLTENKINIKDNRKIVVKMNVQRNDPQQQPEPRQPIQVDAKITDVEPEPDAKELPDL